jgi:hypothetical protein
MKHWYKHNDRCYFIHRSIAISRFTNNEGIINLEGVKLWRDGLSFVDHVLRTDTHFLFVETIQDAETIEDIEGETKELVEEAHS